MALSYVGFAQQVADMAGEDMFRAFPQLGADCIEPTQNHPSQRETAEALTGMIRRHGQTVVQVIKGQIERYSEDLAAGKLPAACLLRLVAAQADKGALGQMDESTLTLSERVKRRITYSPDFSTVTVNGNAWHFVGMQAKAIGFFIKQIEEGVPDLNQQLVLTEIESNAKRLRDVFRGAKAWGTLLKPVADKQGF